MTVIVFLAVATFATVLNSRAAQLPGKRMPSDWRGAGLPADWTGSPVHYRRRGVHSKPKPVKASKTVLALSASTPKDATA